MHENITAHGYAGECTELHCWQAGRAVPVHREAQLPQVDIDNLALEIYFNFIFHCYQVRLSSLCAALMSPQRTKQLSAD